LDLEAVRRVRLLFFVGEQDVTAEFLPQNDAANRFGRTRVERADTLHTAWAAASIDHIYVRVPGMGHADLDLAMDTVRGFLGSA
jgi:hypothetical protein